MSAADSPNPDSLNLTVPAGAGGADGVPKTDPVIYTDDEMKFRSNMIARLLQMRFMRDRNHPELDNMTYLEYYESNRRKDLSYLIPKKNRQDVRIVTGMTREKDSTLLTTCLDLNLNPSITAFDIDDEIVNEFGDNMSDMVKKSREIEDWETLRPSVYRELIAQGDVFVEEIHVEEFRNMPVHRMEWDPIYKPISDFTVRRRLEKVFSGCRARMVNGKKVYLGNIRAEYIQKQPIVAVLNIYPRTEAAGIYGQWERWKHVPYKLDTVNTYWDDGKTYKDWNLVALSDYDKVAEIKVYDPILNQFQIFLNGVMMLPHNFPLSYISASGEIPMAQGKNEVITDYCYGKSQPSKVKVDQEILDETTKIIIEKMRQSWKPPKATRGQGVFSDRIYMAGQITSNMSSGDLQDIISTPGATQADFSFYKLISDSISSKTVTPEFAGESQGGDQTATEIQQQKNQQMLKLGLTIDGIVNLERRMTWLRIYNILDNWTKDDDAKIDDTRDSAKKAVRTFSVETSLEDGSAGIKQFRFHDQGDRPNIFDHHDEEEQLSRQHGKPVRIVYLDRKEARALKYRWFIVMNPSPKSNDHLSQLMFVNNVTTAMQLFGPQALNVEYLKQRYATKIKENYDKFFLKTPPGMPQPGMMPGQQQQPGQGGPGAGAGVGMPGNGGGMPASAPPGGGMPMKAMMGR